MHTHDLNRELDKIEEALSWALKHLTKDSESKAALHMNTTVHYSPLAIAVIDAQNSLANLRHVIKENLT